MAPERISENIYRIPIPLPNSPLCELNSYLIVGADRMLLIDSGFRTEACRAALLAGLEELNVVPSQLDFFLTHLHSDHSGLAAEMVSANHRIYVGSIDLQWLRPEDTTAKNWYSGAAWIKEAGMPQKVLESFYEHSLSSAAAPPPSCGQYVGVENGEIIQVGDFTLQCILTPGHTPGHMCLWEAKRRIMFTGDHVLFDITPNITIWPRVANSLGDYLDSLMKTREYPVKLALPGHRQTGDYFKRIDELIEHHQIRFQEIENIILSSPGETAYQIAGKMSWSIRAESWATFPIEQKYFALGECIAHLDYLCAFGVLYRQWDRSFWRYFPVLKRDCIDEN